MVLWCYTPSSNYHWIYAYPTCIYGGDFQSGFTGGGLYCSCMYYATYGILGSRTDSFIEILAEISL